MRYTLLSRGVPLGTVDLEAEDLTAGSLDPLPAYEAVRPLGNEEGSRSHGFSHEGIHNFNALMTKANTLLMQHGLHISEGDKQRARAYMAALNELGRLLGQIEAAASPRHELALTGEGVAMPPEFQAVYRAYESARRATMDSFRSAIGAGQI